MTNPQYSLFNQTSFTVPHNRHRGNQEILDAGRKHFSKQAYWFLCQLLRGRKITGLMAMEEFKIQDIRARVYSLRKAGMDISEEKVINGNGAKAWYMTEKEIKEARMILEKLKVVL